MYNCSYTLLPREYVTSPSYNHVLKSPFETDVK